MIRWIGALSGQSQRSALYRVGSLQAPVNVVAEFFCQQSFTNALSWPEKPGASGTATGHGNQGDIWAKPILEKRKLTDLFRHSPGRVGDDASLTHKAIGLDGVGDPSRCPGHRRYTPRCILEKGTKG